jgi:formate hydrogenlyase transcriptional activator
MKIGRIAQGEGPVYTSDVLSDDRLPNKAWMRETGLRSFAGYPLVFRGELLGVMAMFSRRVMTEEEFDQLAIFANHAAIAIKNAGLFSEVQSLKNRLQAENRYLKEEIKSGHDFSEIIGQSQNLQKVLSKVKQVAPTVASVLINGETGTGKELIARAIHNLGPRKSRPLIRVNCAALPSGLIESELFGHEKGAFTGALSKRIGRFELADGGTIFLDEVGDLPLELQSKLLRVLQEQEFERVGGTETIRVNTRVIAATHRDLEDLVKRDQFRADLYYRLSVFPLKMPSLRERKEDIGLLARYFVKKSSGAMGKRIDNISQRVIDQLEAYNWPGNIRELENVIERAVILTTGPELQLDETFDKTNAAPLETVGVSTATMEDIERQHILRVLESTNWVIEGKQAAASVLGLNPSTLRSRMAKLGIKKPNN